MIEHGEARQRRAGGGGVRRAAFRLAGGVPLESRWDEAERGQGACYSKQRAHS